MESPGERVPPITGARTLRIGILSTADIGVRKVIPGMKKAERCEVVAIASRDGARARTTADAMRIARAHDSYEALLADPDVDAIYVPLPNHLHREWAVAAARAGKHVLCEKPLATTSEDAEAIVAACRDAGVVLMEAFMYRLHPTWVAVRDLVTSGRIGRLVTVQSWFSYFNDDPANIRNIAAYGGGALFDIGCYNVNLSRLLFDAEPTRVVASVVRDPSTGVDILTSAILDFPTGIATFTCATRTETDQRVHVYGTTGRISVDIPFNIPPDRPTAIRVIAGGNPPTDPATEVMTFATADPYTVEAERFAAAILDGTPVPIPPEDAIANLRVLERVFAAAAASGSDGTVEVL
jgi:predicted dehydrogenase